MTVRRTSGARQSTFSREEERKDLDLHTSRLLPLTSYPLVRVRERSELSIFLITLHAPLSTLHLLPLFPHLLQLCHESRRC